MCSSCLRLSRDALPFSLRDREKGPTPCGSPVLRMPVTDAELIHFDCPHCSQSIAAEPGDAGRAAGCPTCEQPIQVPALRGSGGADPSPGGMEEQARLLETLASTRAAYDALHGQLEAARQTERTLRAELENAEAVRVRDQRAASEQVAAASAADTELRLALGTARGQLEVLLSERDALKAALDIAQKASLGAEEQATERILAARRQATAAEAAREELARKVELQESELKALRTQLTQDTGGRELLALRDRVRELSESYEGKSVALAQAGDALEQARAEKEALQKQLSEALRRGAVLERKVEEASAENLKADNEVLRGLVKRQKALCRRQSVALIALRSARIFLRTLQSVGILVVLGLAALALDALPEGVKLTIRTWLGIP